MNNPSILNLLYISQCYQRSSCNTWSITTLLLHHCFSEVFIDFIFACKRNFQSIIAKNCKIFESIHQGYSKTKKTFILFPPFWRLFTSTVLIYLYGDIFVSWRTHYQYFASSSCIYSLFYCFIIVSILLFWKIGMIY